MNETAKETLKRLDRERAVRRDALLRGVDPDKPIAPSQTMSDKSVFFWSIVAIIVVSFLFALAGAGGGLEESIERREKTTGLTIPRDGCERERMALQRAVESERGATPEVTAAFWRCKRRG